MIPIEPERDLEKIAFLSLPGLCTGDIFHTAAAQLLWTSHPRVLGVKMITLVTVPEDAGPRVLHDQFGLVPAIYSYFTALRLPFVVAKIPAVGNGDEEDCESAATRISAKALRLLVANQTDQKSMSFTVLWESLKTVNLDSTTLNSAEPVDADFILPPVHHYAATTIMTSYFHDKTSAEDRVRRLHSLRKGLAGNLNVKDEIYQDATNKIHQLRTLIVKARSSSGSGFENAKVILFIYRSVDDGPRSMNPHQDATPGLVSQVKSLAMDQGLITIRVPHGVPRHLMEVDDLDIFDVTNATEMKLKDKRYAACFWSQVCKMEEIFGAVGSRTGSLDIAAFCGLKCFEWDEPLIDELARSKLVTEARRSKQHLERQVPQYLRLCTQACLVSIGLLDVESFDPIARRYERISNEPLKEWLSGKSGIFPEISVDSDTRIVLQRYCNRFLERPDLDIRTQFPISLSSSMRGTVNIDSKGDSVA